MNQSRVAILARKLKTPKAVQKFLRTMPYNLEKNGVTLRSAEEALRYGFVHCFEAAILAAALLESHGYPPLIASFESQDGLDHVLFIFKVRGKWGAIGRSRDEGLHGRRPQFRSLRDLIWSYFDPYVDKYGKITAYQLAHLDETGTNWRASRQNVWQAEQYLLKLPHKPLKSSPKRYSKLYKKYLSSGPMPRQKYWW